MLHDGKHDVRQPLQARHQFGVVEILVVERAFQTF